MAHPVEAQDLGCLDPHEEGSSMFNLDLYSDYDSVVEDDDDDILRNDQDISSYHGSMDSPVIGARISDKAIKLDTQENLNTHEAFFSEHGVSPKVKKLLDLLKLGNKLIQPQVYFMVRYGAGTLTHSEVYQAIKRAKNISQVGEAISLSWHDPRESPITRLDFLLVAPDLRGLEKDLKEVRNFVGGDYISTSQQIIDAYNRVLPKAGAIYSHKVADTTGIVVAKASYTFYGKKTAGNRLHTVGVVREVIPNDNLRNMPDPLTVLNRFKDGDLPLIYMYGKHIEEYYNAWAKQAFASYLRRYNPEATIAKIVNDPELVQRSRNAEIAASGETPTKPTKRVTQAWDHKKKSWGDKSTTDLTPVPLTPRERVLVLGSVPSSVTKTVIPTAKEEERVWMKSDGTIRKPTKIGDQEGRGYVPSLSGNIELAPLVKIGNYKIIYGIYYDNPILGFKKRGHIFWYGSLNLLLSAARTYAVWTGDTPRICFLISSAANTGSTRAGMYMSPSEFKREGAAEEQEVQRAHAKIVKNFEAAVTSGKEDFPEKIHTYFTNKGAKVDPKQFVGYNVPVSWERIKGITPETWEKFLSDSRVKLIEKLGFQLGADNNLWIINKEGERVKYITDTGAGGSKLKRTITNYEDAKRARTTKMKAVWDTEPHSGSRLEEKDEWKNYMITYLLGHKAYASTLNSFMLPVRVRELPGKGVVPTGRHLSASEDKYVEAMWDASLSGVPAFRILANARGQRGSAAQLADLSNSNKTNAGRKWYYLPSSFSQAFPYARMVMPDVRTDHQVAEANAKLKKVSEKHPLERTKLGYRYQGFEFRAYQMFVSMPKSKAEKKFKISRGGEGVDVFSNPGFMEVFKTHLNKGTRGNPMALGLSPRQSRFVGVGDNFYGFKNPQTIDPTSISGRKETVLPTYYFSHPAFDAQWKPEIKQVEQGINRLTHTYVHDVKKLGNDLKQSVITKHEYEELVREAEKVYGRKTKNHMHTSASLLLKMLNNYKYEIGQEKARDIGAMAGDTPAIEAFDNLDNFIQHVRADFNSRENITDEGKIINPNLPNVTKGIRTTSYKAILGYGLGQKELHISIKAPTSDMAKLYIMYRLLRRSSSNPVLGQQAYKTIMGTEVQRQKFLAAKYLFDWADSGYLVLPDHDVRGLKYLPHKKRYEKNEFMVKHSAKYGDHATARLVGFGTG